MVRRGFYFLYSHNEWPAVTESYSFTAYVRADGRLWRTIQSTEGSFWYQPLTQGDGAAGPSLKPLKNGQLPSSQLPAIVAFAADVPLGTTADASVVAFDQLQRQYPADVKPLVGEFIHAWEGTLLAELPLLPAAPRIFLKPITYEIHTTKPLSYQAAFRLVVEDISGHAPQVWINGRSVRLGRPAPAEMRLQMSRWDFHGSTRVTPDNLVVSVRCRNSEGLEAEASYRFRKMNRYGEWGYEVDALAGTDFSPAPGGRTPLVPYAGVFARVGEIPVLTTEHTRPEINQSARMRISIDKQVYPTTADRVIVSEEPSTVCLRDRYGDPFTWYVWDTAWRTDVFVLADTRQRLHRDATDRLILPRGDVIAVIPDGTSSSQAAIGSSAVAVAGEPREFGIGSLQWRSGVLGL